MSAAKTTAKTTTVAQRLIQKQKRAAVAVAVAVGLRVQAGGSDLQITTVVITAVALSLKLMMSIILQHEGLCASSTAVTVYSCSCSYWCCCGVSSV
jgi:hypothetical protein